MNWCDIDYVRNELAYPEELPVKRKGYSAAAAMRKLYAKRIAMGLTAHGKPRKRPVKKL